MSSNESRRSRLATSLLALSAIAAMTAALASPASAASGQGEATIVAANHGKGRTLSGQGVKLLAAAGASSRGGKLVLPIGDLTTGPQASASSAGSISFKRGKRSLTLTGIRFDLGAGTLVGKLGESEIPVFKLGAAPVLNGDSVALRDGKLQLTAEAASALKQKLGLRRDLIKRGVGMVWLEARIEASAPATPIPPAPEPPQPSHAAAQAIAGGAADWGVLASWRSYVLGNFGPGSVGTISTGEGATSTGTLSEAGAFFSFPAASGSYERGLDGATDRLTLETQGSVKFAKPGHCIIEVKLANLELTIDGADSAIALDSIYDIDTPAGMSCTDQPAVATADVDFATLDVSAVTPTYSASGKTITWSAVPAKLTAAGAAAFGSTYPEGQELDPVTISVDTE
jgi:hypothetical protein